MSKLSVLHVLPLLTLFACASEDSSRLATKVPPEVQSACGPYLAELRSSSEDNAILDPDDPALQGRVTAAEPISTPPPLYPPKTIRNGSAGTVGLAAIIELDGSLSHARVMSSSRQKVLDDAALDAVKTYSFKPARLNGEPARTFICTLVTFHSFMN